MELGLVIPMRCKCNMALVAEPRQFTCPLLRRTDGGVVGGG